MNKRIDLTHIGGFPATQFTLDFMQESYRSTLAALANLCGDKVIVTGCVDDGTNISSGWLAINGELIPLAGGPKGDGDIVISETNEERDFEDAETHPVYYSKVAQLGSPGDFNYSELTNIGTLKTIFQNLADLTADFNALTYSTVPERPDWYISHAGTHNIGDLSAGDSLVTVTIPNQGGTSYKVVGALVSQSANHALDNDVSWAVREKTATSFKISLREYETVTQNLAFDYAILKSLS